MNIMKQFQLLIVAFSLTFFSIWSGFSQSSYYATDIVKVDPQNDLIYSILNGKVVVFDIKTQQLLKIITPNNKMTTITTIELNQDKLAIISKNECCIVDLIDGKQVFFKINEENDYPHQVRAKLSADNSKIYIAREKDINVKVYDTKSGKLIEKSFSLGTPFISNFAISPDRKTLVTSNADFSSGSKYFLVFWDINTQKVIKKVVIPGQPVSLKFNGDGSLVGAAFQMSDIKKVSKKPVECDQTTRKFELGIQIFDSESKKLVQEFPIFSMFKGTIRDFEFDYNNSNVIYSIYDSYKELFSYNILTNEVKQIYSISWFNLGFYKDYLITVKNFNSYDGLKFVNTKDKEKDLLFKQIDYEPFYIDQNLVN
jgi:WD40 repeat protein